MWNAIKKSLHGLLSESELNLWINPIQCQHQEGEVLTLTGPDRFFCAWVADRYLEHIRRAALEIGQFTDVRLLVATPQIPDFENGRGGQLLLPGTAPAPKLRSLHPAFTFDQFMMGESNLLAGSACKALAAGEKTFGNCLFMNSSTGLGKSHLTQAVVHQVLQTAPSTRIHYLTAQQFAADMVKNIRAKSMELFSRKYVSNCDMLLVEDIHTLTGKAKTQEELNTILDYLIKSGRRVILTSAVPHNKLTDFDEDFRSRIASGLVTGITSPDFETRTRIIRHKMSLHGLSIPDDQVGFIAEHLRGDVRRIENAIIGIKAQCCMRKTGPDSDIIRDVVFGLTGGTAEVTAESIRDLVGRQFRVSVDDLCSRSRKRTITFPRQMAMYLTRKFTNQSLADIGCLYNRDHSTVLHAIKTITREMRQQASVRQQIEILTAQLKR